LNGFQQTLPELLTGEGGFIKLGVDAVATLAVMASDELTRVTNLHE
jgi:hypothetical protein